MLFVAALAMSGNRKFALPLIICGIIIIVIGALLPGSVGALVVGGLVLGPALKRWRHEA